MLRAVVVMIAACLPLAAQAGNALDTYVELATGSFDSSAQAAADKRYATATWHIAEIWSDDDTGARWLYAENWQDGAGAPYRQRVVRVTADDGGLVARSYRLTAPERFTGGWREPERFAELDRTTLNAVDGCDVRLAQTGERRFEGGTVGQRCRTSYKDAAYVVSQSVLDETGMTNWDRGFKADGTLAWGPAAGGYEFVRSGESTCKKPVRMLVYGTIDDRTQIEKYIKAIRDSGLYPRYQGYYEATTPALDVFEGDPPEGRAVVIVNFPCRAAAEGFWQSPEYRAIVPLREGAAEFEVLLLPALPVPAYIL